jgi:hypothetical protein
MADGESRFPQNGYLQAFEHACARGEAIRLVVPAQEYGARPLVAAWLDGHALHLRGSKRGTRRGSGEWVYKPWANKPWVYKPWVYKTWVYAPWVYTTWVYNTWVYNT